MRAKNILLLRNLVWLGVTTYILGAAFTIYRLAMRETHGPWLPSDVLLTAAMFIVISFLSVAAAAWLRSRHSDEVVIPMMFGILAIILMVFAFLMLGT